MKNNLRRQTSSSPVRSTASIKKQKNMLRFSSVVKHFNNVRAVDGLSFSVEKGEIFALLGPNGAGKTTSVRMIMNIIEPDSGEIRFDTSILENGKVNRSRLGYLPEERGLYQDVPILKTITYLAMLRGASPDTIQNEALQWLERFGLADRKNEKISTLSKGNQQKVQFIASILHKPAFAVLDEPFSGFDPINQEMISDCIRELRDAGMTVLLSAHQMQLVEKIADRILLIGDGKELLSGTLEEIRRKTVSKEMLVVEYENGVSPEDFSASTNIRGTSLKEDGRLEVYLGGQSDLNTVLAELAGAGKLKKISTSEANLHDIFIQSFKNKGAAS